MKNFKYIKGRKAVLACFIYILASSSLFAQEPENPWASKPQGENPWLTEEQLKEQAKEKAAAEEVAKEEIIETTVVAKTTTPEAHKYDVVANSTSTVRHFKINNEIVKLNTNNYNYIKNLKKEAMKSRDAHGALAAGLISGSFANIIALPFNLAASTVPTPTTLRLAAQFQRDNPHASTQEIRAVKRGMRQKRLQKAVAGNLVGAVINIVAIAVITRF